MAAPTKQYLPNLTLTKEELGGLSGIPLEVGKEVEINAKVRIAAVNNDKATGDSVRLEFIKMAPAKPADPQAAKMYPSMDPNKAKA